MAPSYYEIIRSKIKKYQAFREYSQYFAATFRSLKIQLLWQTTKWSKRHESKKTAIYSNRVAALLHALLHLVPLAAGIALVVLNLKTTFIGSFRKDGLAGLQFPAKVLEILIQASITAAVLGLVRVRVLGAAEVPFGGLIAPLRITDVSSLWSLEFWGCFTSTRIDLFTRLGLSTILPAAAILAAVVGPSSAVLMIPRPLAHLDLSQLFILNQWEYPRRVGLTGGRLQSEADFNQTLPQALLSAAWPTQLVDEFGTRGLKWAAKGGRSIATVPSGAFATFSLGNLTAPTSDIVQYRALQPYVEISCWEDKVTVTDPDAQYVDFGPEQPDLQGTLSFTKVVPTFSKPADDESLAVYHFPNFSDNTYFINNASLLWTRPPLASSNHSLVMVLAYTESSDDLNVYHTTACTFGAFWARVTAQSSLNSPLSNEIPNDEEEDPLKSLSRLRERELILLEPEWAKRTLTTTIEVVSVGKISLVPTSMTYTSIYALALSYVPQFDYTVAWDLVFQRGQNLPSYAGYAESTGTKPSEQQFTAMIQYIDSNKLQRKYDEGFVYSNDTGFSPDFTDPASLAQIELRSYSNGYGYDSSPAAVKLSLAVMIIYITTTIAFLTYTMITGQVATSWDTVAELVTLALNSKTSPALKNTSVGIDTVEVFRQPVNIRVNQEDTLEIVFDAASQSGKYAKVVPNKKY